jgi:ABC-type transport system substrate-binding protein
VFRLARPTSAFPAALEAAAIDPELSTGPFRLLEDTDTHRVYEAFPGFWGGPPKLAGVRIDFYKTPRAAWAALLRNDADFLYDVPPEALPLLARNPDIRLRAARPLQVLTLGFQVGRPRLRDVRIRRAINLAIDREELARRVFANYLEVTDGITSTRSGPFAPDYWAVEGGGPAWPYDPAQARALVREATGGTGDLELVCITGNQLPLVADLVAGIEAQLQRVHIRLRIVPLEISAFGARMQGGDFDLFAVPMAAGFGAFFPYRFWHSASPARLLTTGYSGANAELDALYTASSEDAERAAAHAVLDVMYRDPPAAFLLPMPIIRAFRRGWHVPDEPKDIRYSLPRWTREIGTPCGQG